MTAPPLPDAGRNWVDDHAPAALRPWLRLGRFDRPIGIWLLLLPGWWGLALALTKSNQPVGVYEAWLFLGFAVGACLMRAAGCAFNDIVDRDFDARVARTAARPIPSGQITVRQAWGFVVGCSLIALGILLSLNAVAVLLGFASLVLVAAYPFMKRITWWPQAWLGLTFNWGVPLGYAAATSVWVSSLFQPPYQARPLEPVWAQLAGIAPWVGFGPSDLMWQIAAALSCGFIYAGAVFWTLGYDTIYALQDIEDDAMVGVRSSARRLGSHVRRGVAIFYGASVVLIAVGGWVAALGPVFWVGLVAFAAHLVWQVRRLRLDSPALALSLFRSNREAGWLALFAIVAGGLPA